MSLTREFNFLAILDTNIASTLLKDAEIASYVRDKSKDNIAALLHFNAIKQSDDPAYIQTKLLELQLVAAFARKDLDRMKELVIDKRVSVAARLDYGLPLYDQSLSAGEDIFVAATKALLGGNQALNFKLPANAMKHKTGPQTDTFYSPQELNEIENYVDNSFAIRELLANPDNNHAAITPDIDAVNDILARATHYRDSNNNPLIVFIPGLTSIPGINTSTLITTALLNRANVNDIGFFGVPGIVWSIILGDVDAVRTFITNKASLTIEDEMGNNHVMFWAAATYQAVSGNEAYKKRILEVMIELGGQLALNIKPNFIGKKPDDYLDETARNYLRADYESKQLVTSRFAQFYSNTNQTSTTTAEAYRSEGLRK
jgi:hypothetical protein